MYESISGQNNSTYKLDLRIWLLNKSHIFPNKNLMFFYILRYPVKFLSSSLAFAVVFLYIALWHIQKTTIADNKKLLRNNSNDNEVL